MSKVVHKTVQDEAFAEVIYSTSEVIIAQCYKEDNSAKGFKSTINQGSIVKIISSYDNSYLSYGLITKINNTSLDHIHKPSALGLNQEELAELQPQVYELLKKELEIYLFAHKDNNILLTYPPQRPMMIHDFVKGINSQESLELTENITDLINVIKKNQLKMDLLVNLIELGLNVRENDYNYLIKAGKEISLAFSDEVEMLFPVLKRLSRLKAVTTKTNF
jgi:hypothetical protein